MKEAALKVLNENKEQTDGLDGPVKQNQKQATQGRMACTPQSQFVRCRKL